MQQAAMSLHSGTLPGTPVSATLSWRHSCPLLAAATKASYPGPKQGTLPSPGPLLPEFSPLRPPQPLSSQAETELFKAGRKEPSAGEGTCSHGPGHRPGGSR